MTDLKSIKTDGEYKEALKIADELFDAKVDTPEGDRLEMIVTLIEIYEKEHFPIDNPSPVEAMN